MGTRNLVIVVFLLHTAVGILGNGSLLCHYLFYFTKCRFRSIDTILMNTTVANILVILSKGIPETMAALGSKDFLGDFGCKLLFYLHKLGRDVSIGTTCFLSVFQAITISPRDSIWAEFTVKIVKYIGPSNLLFWIPNMAFDIMVPVHVTGKCSNRSEIDQDDYGYCASVQHDKVPYSVYLLLVLVRDVLCVGLTPVLCQQFHDLHPAFKQQIQYIHRIPITHTALPEDRATRNILALVSTFVSLYTLSSIFHIYLSILRKSSLCVRNIATLSTECFPMICHYILMIDYPGSLIG